MIDPDDYQIQASRATAPAFYRAPYPPGQKPREYQLGAVEYALGRPHCLLGDEPGLGKTPEAVMLGNAIRAERTVVVCPASLRLNWEREIWRWSTIPNVRTSVVEKAKDGISTRHNYVILSYDLLRNEHILASLLAEKWDHLVLDEAHAIKDPKGNRRTKAICGWVDRSRYVPGLADAAKRITLCSGTIMPNQPIEAYNAIRLLNHQAIDQMSLEAFRKYYYAEGTGFSYRNGKPVWSNHVRNVPQNLDELQHRMRKHIMVRRLKAHVLTELPVKQWHPFPMAMTAALRAAMRHPGWASAERLYEMDEHAFDHGVPIDGAISTARRVLGEAKAPSVCDYIDDLIASGVDKLVVAAWHHSVLDYMRKELAPHGLVYIDGSTTPSARQAAVDAFQADGRVKVILGQTIPLGEGITLTAAQDIVLSEPDWTPGRNDQLFDRIHRMGQKGAHVICHVPVVPGTLDEKVLGTAIAKDTHIHKALDAR